MAELDSFELELITVPEVARQLHVVPDTIYNWIAAGRLTYDDGLLRVGGRTLFHWPTLRSRALGGLLDPARVPRRRGLLRV